MLNASMLQCFNPTGICAQKCSRLRSLPFSLYALFARISEVVTIRSLARSSRWNPPKQYAAVLVFSFVHHSKRFYSAGCKLSAWKVILDGWPSACEWSNCSKKRTYRLHGMCDVERNEKSQWDITSTHNANKYVICTRFQFRNLHRWSKCTWNYENWLLLQFRSKYMCVSASICLIASCFRWVRRRACFRVQPIFFFLFIIGRNNNEA